MENLDTRALHPAPTPPKETSNQARVKLYRANHRRIDYAPGPDALAIIEKHLRAGLNNYSLAGVIDDLVMAGDQVISGNRMQPTEPNRIDLDYKTK